ncbi:MAG: ATP-binding protein [Victivallales bacterium]|jgi:DNA replication protein DnaC|nr:ATP-binding protein [Victivallales bacterium]
MEAEYLEIRIVELCRALKLPAVGRDATRLAREAVRQSVNPLAYVVDLLETELEERRTRRAQRRVKEANFPVAKTLEGFDFKRASHLPESLLRNLAEGSYIENAEPILFLGEPGTGKTHLATALGFAAAQQGRKVRFTTAASLVTELIEAKDSRQLTSIVNRHARVDVLILDELAYLPLSRSDAELLFRVLGERQERRPIIVTTNLPFSEWTTMFPDPRLCKAVVDRLTYRAHIIETGMESDRLSQTIQRQNRRKKP